MIVVNFESQLLYWMCVETSRFENVWPEIKTKNGIPLSTSCNETQLKVGEN